MSVIKKKAPAKSAPSAEDVGHAVRESFGDEPTRSRTVDVRKLLTGIPFSSDDVIRAATENSVMFVDAIEFRRQQIWRRSTAKIAHERAEADAELRFRKKARDDGEKITEANIKALVLVDEDVTSAAAALAEAEELDEYSKLVVEVFRMRRDCLQIVKGLLADEWNSQRAVEAGAEKMREARETLRKRLPARKDED